MIKATIPRKKSQFEKRKEEKVTERIILEGVESLRVEKVTTTVELIRELDPETNQLLSVKSNKKVAEKVEISSCFSLTEVSPEEITGFREQKVPSFVLKVDGKLYHTEVPKNINLISLNIFGKHQCAIGTSVCHRLSAASDEQGGCEKVRKRSKYIERYPWIVTGYEAFNTKNEWFVVVKCLHYEECPPREKLKISEIKRRKISLALFFCDDVEDLED